jgi:hypothetical protein
MTALKPDKRTPREIADEAIERIEYRIQAHHPRERTLIRDLIEGLIEDDRDNRSNDEGAK